MIRLPLVGCRRKVATLFQVGQMQSVSATDILVAQGTRHKAQGTRHKGAIDCEANLETGLVAGSQAGGSWEQGDPILSERDPDPATTADLIRVSLLLLHQRTRGESAPQHHTTTAHSPATNAKAQIFLLHPSTTDKLQSNHYEF